MPLIPDSLDAESGRSARADAADPEAIERRMFRVSCWAVVAAVVLSAPLAPWRVTTGLLLGGVLSIFNYRWLKSSVRSAFRQTVESGLRPDLSAARFLLRYLIIAAVLSVAYWLDLISIVAALIGMCSFVVAVLLEGLMQITFAIIHHEEY